MLNFKAEKLVVLFHKCIEVMGDGCLNNEHFEELGGILKEKLEEHFKNQELRQGKLTQILLTYNVAIL